MEWGFGKSGRIGCEWNMRWMDGILTLVPHIFFLYVAPFVPTWLRFIAYPVYDHEFTSSLYSLS